MENVKNSNQELLLEDKVAFITGAGSGIGAALAKGFAKYGANIVLVGTTEEKLLQIQAEIEKIGRRALSIPLNVQNYEDLKQAFAKTMEKFGKIDILINNAGFSRLYPLNHPKCTPEILDNIIKTNVLGPLYGSHAVLSHMVFQGGGTILSTGSTIIGQPAPGWTVYSMSKSSLLGFTECLALELKSQKINVNLIMPRMVRTPMLRGMKEDLINSMNPMMPEDLVDYYAFFATKTGKKLTGQLVNVDKVEKIIGYARSLPKENQNWADVKEWAEDTFSKEEFKKIKKMRKLIDFLLR
ncbi:MAG: hypothetical protein DRO88_03410 [Promethearchaeia archaeon]|nr:MAG: hypothetical protein DRO88_03410 [Candidatus Lokiarchaeia archaeon]